MPLGQADPWCAEAWSCCAVLLQPLRANITYSPRDGAAPGLWRCSKCSLHVQRGLCGVGRSCLLEPRRAQPLTDQSGTQHRGIFRLVERIHPWKCPGAICAPWDLMGHSCPPQPQLLGSSPAFRCLCDPFGYLQRDGEQVWGADPLSV